MDRPIESSRRISQLAYLLLVIFSILGVAIPGSGQQPVDRREPFRQASHTPSGALLSQSPSAESPVSEHQVSGAGESKPPLNSIAPWPQFPSAIPGSGSQGTASTPLTLDEAVRLALAVASEYEQARFSELIANEDVRQARMAFLPRMAGTSSFTYNSPAQGSHTPGQPSEFSFINANAIQEYEALAGFTGEIDLAGRLRATLRRNVALLEAARAGTEVARRALVRGVNEAYFGLSLAAAQRRSAEQSLSAAEEFERITRLLLDGGEVAEVDFTRARLQSATRRDELEQSRLAEVAAADSLRVFVGYDFTRPIVAADLLVAPPDTSELDRYTVSGITRRPEFVQFEAQRRAADQEMKAARAERLPQISYFVDGGFDTDSLHHSPVRMHTGVLAGITLTIPLFDWGASRSRESQAQLRARTAESQRKLALRSLGEQFYTARAQAYSAAARVRILQASVSDAERNVEASIARYRAGEAAILEVTDAQTTLATQRAALFQALFDYQIARTRVAQAAGQ